jgi:hypothetical protein
MKEQLRKCLVRVAVGRGEERRGVGWGEVRWRSVGLSLYIGA